MGPPLPPCSFCSRAAMFGPFDGVFVCEKCAIRIGDIAWKDAVSGTSLIWLVTSRPVRPDLADKPPWRPPSADSSSRIDVKEVSRSFDPALASGVSSYDGGMSHADCAQAYNEMGLNSDALREAAIVLDPKTSTSPEAARMAVWVLLSPRLLKPGGLRKLKSRLRVAPLLH